MHGPINISLLLCLWAQYSHWISWRHGRLSKHQTCLALGQVSMNTLNRNVTFLSASISLLYPIVDPTGNTLITPLCTLMYDSGYEQDAQGKIWGSHNSGDEAWNLLGCNIGGFHHFEGSQCLHLLGQAGILLGLSVPCDMAPQPRIHLLHAILNFHSHSFS